MSKDWRTLAPRAMTYFLQAVALVAAVWALGRLFSIVPARIGYAGEIEWMEGGILHHVKRVAMGKPLYVEPGMDFTPYIYTPFYYYLCAALSPLFGLDIALLRSVSFASFLGSCGLMVLWTSRRTKHWYLGLIGAGLFAATFRLGGAWFDIARGDSLLVFLLLLSGLLLFEFRCQKSAVAAACVLACAFLTKQSAVIPVATLLTWVALVRSRRLLIFGGVTAGLIVVFYAALHFSSDGWFTYYAFQLPSEHPLLEDWKLLYWKNDVFGVMAVPALLLIVLLVGEFERAENKLEGLGLSAYAAGIVGMTWSSRFHLGMYENVLMPLHALLSLTTTLVLVQLLPAQGKSLGLSWASLVAVSGFIWKLEYPIEQQVPTEAHEKQYKQLVTELKKLPQGTWVAFHSLPAIDAGHPPRAHWMGLIDVNRGKGAVPQKLTEDCRKWLESHEAPAIVWSIDDRSTSFFSNSMRRYYRRAGRIAGPAPLTGWGQMPREIWVPREPGEEPRPPAAKRRRPRGPER